jgi:hypothetical protein
MEVGTRGLFDVPTDSYAFGPDTVTCASVAAGPHSGMTCATFDWSVL